jgi:hypothetical protein
MFYSDRFLKRLARLRKEHREAPEEEQVELVREAFTGLVRGAPDAMVAEIYEQFAERIVNTADDGRIFIDRAEYLADIADVLAGQYDGEHDPLSEEDFRLLGEIVNDYALDLDMGQVNYIMQLVVEHHAT